MDFEFDVFLSHSSKDKDIVRPLAKRLHDDGLRVWFDEWSIADGAMIPLAIEDGLQKSRRLVLFMSVNAFGADWVTLEHQSFRFSDPANRTLRFIPARLDDAELKPSLIAFKYIDWRKQEEEAYQRLLTACRPPSTTPACLQGELDLDTIANACPRGGLQLDFVDDQAHPIHQANQDDDYKLRVRSMRAGYLLFISQGTDKQFRLLHPNQFRAQIMTRKGEFFLPGELLPLPNAILGPDVTRLYFQDAGTETALALLSNKLPANLSDGEALAIISSSQLRKILQEAWTELQTGSAELAFARILIS